MHYSRLTVVRSLAGFVAAIFFPLIFIAWNQPTSEVKAAANNSGRKVTMIVTAYDPGCKICDGKYAGACKTSIGKNARQLDGVAAAHSLLPLGTRLNIPGVGERVVDDTGGGMRQSAKKGVYHIDLRVATHKQAKAWGKKTLEVTILSTPKVQFKKTRKKVA